MESDELRRMEENLSSILRGGVLASALIIAVGFVLASATGDTSHPFGVMDLRWVILGDPFFSPSHILFLGFLVLIATPVLRIAISALIFLRNRDYTFASITLIVLVILIASFLLGVG